MAYNDLSLSERAQIIHMGVQAGLKSLKDIQSFYDNAAREEDYDYTAAIKAGETPATNGHWSDKYKKPNHPTFSDESIYHSQATPGGRWTGNTYEPSDFVLNQQGGWNQFLRGFYNQEQGTGAVPVFNGGVMLPEIEVRPSPKYKKSSEAYYDPETDTVFAPDSTGEFYTHERFHARPNKEYLQKIAPYYENLNDSVLTSMGADLPFINRNGDPGQYYSPEEIGARVAASLGMLKKAGVSKIDSNFVKESRKNELKYGDNYRDLLHMYNDDIITDMLNSYANGGSIHIAPSKKGTFTAAATKHGKSVQAFASQVLAHKENYSPAMVKKANFARNASKWHADGGHLYSPGGFFTMLKNKFFGNEESTPTYTRVHENDSPTKTQSEQYEDLMNQRLAVKDNKYDHKWDIPYLDDKEIKIAGHRVSSNALDSLAKYAEITGVPIDEAVGLAMYETHLGAAPFLNYTKASNNATAEEKARVAATNRALGNASFFRNYYYIPAWALIRDNEYIQEGYNETKKQKEAGMSPLEHGLLLYKNGKYNQGLGKGVHTKNVKEKAAIIRQDPMYQQWLSSRALGGPLYLYPFSFKKNEDEKTPLVRYSNGGNIGHQYGFV